MTKDDILSRLRALHEDFTMLKNGDWIPDNHSCDASIESCEALIEAIEQKDI